MMRRQLGGSGCAIAGAGVHQRFQFVQQRLDVVQAQEYIVGAVGILVEVSMQIAGHPVQPADFPVAGFLHQSRSRLTDVPVTTVGPAALLGDGLEHLGGCAPAFFGGLARVALPELGPRLRQKRPAGAPISFDLLHKALLRSQVWRARLIPSDGGEARPD